MTEPADVARAFNEWTPDRKDLEIAALRARVAELEAERAGVDDFRLMLAKLVHRLRQRPDLPAKEMIEQAADLLARKGGASILRSTPDPRDARIAELEEQYRLLAHAYCRTAGIAPNELISDAGHEAWELAAHDAIRGIQFKHPRIAELEAKLAEVEEQHLTYLQRLCCDIALKQASDGRSAAGRIAELEAALREIADRWATRSPTGAIARRPFAGPDQCAS